MYKYLLKGGGLINGGGVNIICVLMLWLFLLGTIIGGVMTGFRMELTAAFHIELLAMAALLAYIFSSAGIFYKQTRRLAEIRVELENKNEILNDTVQELENTRNELIERPARQVWQILLREYYIMLVTS